METIHQRNFKSIHRAKRSRMGSKYLEKGRNRWGESETSVLGELNPPKNSKIPRRNLEIANGGLKASPQPVLERRGVKSE
jgi:hypothetical protein